MFDFPQPGEKYSLNNRLNVMVIGILHNGIPHELPYRCPGVVWNPYRKPYSIVIRIENDGRIIELSLAHFLRDYRCIGANRFKRDPANRHAVLKEMANNTLLNARRNNNDMPGDTEKLTLQQLVSHRPTKQDWQHRQHGGQPDNYHRFL
ncbi:hypothetical protein SME23J_29180 [Serratia marcescens]|nr:hypothetical protein SME23J_29180 [Serratia marcescens]